LKPEIKVDRRKGRVKPDGEGELHASGDPEKREQCERGESMTQTKREKTDERKKLGKRKREVRKSFLLIHE
jgi:hypothetical protein